MKKLFASVIAVMLALAMLVMSGCKLIETNQEKNVKQVVAVVQIDETAPKDEILKKDVLLGYLNYGYYQEYQGTSREKVINDIVKNLVHSRVYLQNAMLRFSANDGIYAGNIVKPELALANKFDVNAYLTDEEIVEATYLAKKMLNDNIESYEKADDEKLGDTYTGEVRKTPTGAENAKDPEPTFEDKKNYQIIVDVEGDGNKRYDAVNAFLEVLEANNLLGAYKTNIEETDYYVETLQSQKEQIVIDKYVKCIYDSVQNKYDFDDVKALYLEKLAKQEKWTDADYSTALSSASATTPILYAPTGTYGYVYNLLIGITDDQKAELKEWDEQNPSADASVRNAKRAEILSSSVVTDLRSSWILNGYDFDGTKFTGDYALAGDDSLAFGGDTILLNGEDKNNDDYTAEYGVSEVDELSLDEFIKLFETYLYGSAQTDNVNYTDGAVYKAVNSSNANANYDQRVNELLFAYSTDPGSLNTYKGYAISPIPDGSDKETWQQEFADYGRELLAMGPNSYIMVATDYGYHIMFYSESYKVGAVYSDLEKYLDGECAQLKADGQTWESVFEQMQKDWVDITDTNSEKEFDVKDTYLYALYNELVVAEINELYNKDYVELIDKYVYLEDGKVEIFEDRYQDLIDVEQ
ncbi:MAG: hypothetical protein E7382_02520 [Clostridiales bacterium]|nr:hypothetical protein [Clostridiales bacterium]